MNGRAVPLHPAARAARRRARTAAGVLATWRSLTRIEVRTAVLAGSLALVCGLLERMGEMDFGDGWHRLAVALAGLSVYPALFTASGLLAWAVADRSERDAGRPLRLAGALVAASTVAAVATVGVLLAAGVGDFCDLASCRGMPAGDGSGRAWVVVVGHAGWLLVCAALLVAIVEARRAGAAADDARAAVLRERARLLHDAYATRMAAMQAQVEPQFLFDTLVDVAHLYETDKARGARTLDALIAFLRTALPRLGEPASTVAAEVQLVRAWLAVVTARHAGLPACSFRVAGDCGAARAWPMLLLPLVQRAVGRIGDTPPPRVALDVACVSVEGSEGGEGRDVVVVLDVAARGRCTDDPELQRVRDRLARLCGDRGRLDCVQDPASGDARWTLRWPLARRADAPAAVPA